MSKTESVPSSRTPSPLAAIFEDFARDNVPRRTPSARRSQDSDGFAVSSQQSPRNTAFATPVQSQESNRSVPGRSHLSSSERSKRGPQGRYTVEDRETACKFLSSLRLGYDEATQPPVLSLQYEAFATAFADHPRLRDLPRQTLEGWYSNSLFHKEEKARGRPTILPDRTLHILHLVIKELVAQHFPVDWGWIRECAATIEKLENPKYKRTEVSRTALKRKLIAYYAKHRIPEVDQLRRVFDLLSHVKQSNVSLFRKVLRMEHKRAAIVNRKDMRLWYMHMVLANYKKFKITQPWQVINGDESYESLDSTTKYGIAIGLTRLRAIVGSLLIPSHIFKSLK